VDYESERCNATRRVIGGQHRPSPGDAANGTNSTDLLIERLNQVTDQKVRILRDPKTGRVRFIGTDLEHPVVLEGLPRFSVTPEQAGRSFLATYGTLFGLENADQELVVLREQSLQQGVHFVRFQQLHHSIPVLGGEIIVEMDSDLNIISAICRVLSQPGVETVAAVDQGPHVKQHSPGCREIRSGHEATECRQSRAMDL